jgi:hypothetical protein
MSRVLRVGGRMAVHDFDWESQLNYYYRKLPENHSDL